jgi:hypothetical protein
MEWILYIVLLVNDNQNISIGNIHLDSHHTSYQKCIYSGREKIIEFNESIPLKNIKTHIYGYDCKERNNG